LVVLATQTPPTRVLPAPQPYAACVIMASGSCTGATGMACTDIVSAKANKEAAINLSIGFPPRVKEECTPGFWKKFGLRDFGPP
jgi:hypothetical protein